MNDVKPSNNVAVARSWNMCLQCILFDDKFNCDERGNKRKIVVISHTLAYIYAFVHQGITV
jgi:hypothetical protein